jgi:hypothetical protein
MAVPGKLPVFETVGNAISYSLKNLVVMVKLCWLWILAVIATGAIVFLLFVQGGSVYEGESEASGPPAAFFFAILPVLAVYVAALYSVAVGWHRRLLLGEEPGWIYLRFGLRELGYLGYSIAIFLVGGLGIFVGAAITAVGSGLPEGAAAPIGFAVIFAGVLAMFLVLARLHLVLPGVAVGDRRMSLKESFALTRGNGWRIVGGFLLIGLLNGVVNVLSTIFEKSAETSAMVATVVFGIVALLASIVVAFITLSYMSYCYWFFVPPPEEGDLA